VKDESQLFIFQFDELPVHPRRGFKVWVCQRSSAWKASFHSLGRLGYRCAPVLNRLDLGNKQANGGLYQRPERKRARRNMQIARHFSRCKQSYLGVIAADDSILDALQHLALLLDAVAEIRLDVCPRIGDGKRRVRQQERFSLERAVLQSVHGAEYGRPLHDCEGSLDAIVCRVSLYANERKVGVCRLRFHPQRLYGNVEIAKLGYGFHDATVFCPKGVVRKQAEREAAAPSLVLNPPASMKRVLMVALAQTAPRMVQFLAQRIANACDAACAAIIRNLKPGHFVCKRALIGTRRLW